MKPTTADLLGKVNVWLLPRPNGQGHATLPGKLVKPQLSPPMERILDVATTLGRRAGRRYQQI